MNFEKFLRTLFLTEHLRWLLLSLDTLKAFDKVWDEVLAFKLQVYGKDVFYNGPLWDSIYINDLPEEKTSVGKQNIC